MENFMYVLASIIAIIMSFLAIFAYQWVTAFPRLGIATLYHLSKVRVGVGIIALTLAGSAYALNPTTGQLVVLIIVIALTPFSGANSAKKFLVALDNPRHVSGDQAELGEDAPVIGINLNGKAIAWSLALIVPHHLANDVLGDIPMLAAW